MARGMRTAVVLSVLTVVVGLVPGHQVEAVEVACSFADEPPAARPGGIGAGIHVTNEVPASPDDQAVLLDHLDALSGGQPERLPVAVFTHFTGTVPLPDAEIEHEPAMRWFAGHGYPIEVTIAYRASSADADGFAQYVQRVIERVGPSLHAVMITHEPNIDFWVDGSDGAHPGAVDAMLAGVPRAAATAEAMGLDIEVGMKWGYRHPSLEHERDFWTYIGDNATPQFHAALDFVGIDLYALEAYVGDQTIGEYTLQAVAELRRCFLPLADVSDDVAIHLTETGVPTAQWTEAGQATGVAELVGSAHAYSSTYNVTEWRQYSLMCGPPPDDPLWALLHCSGLVRGDGTRAPAFDVVRQLIEGRGIVSDLAIPATPRYTG